MADILDEIELAPTAELFTSPAIAPSVQQPSAAGDEDDRPQRIASVRVLHVVNGEHYSGAERVQDLLAEYLPACSYEVEFACIKPDRFPAARTYREAKLYELPMRGRFDRKVIDRLTDLVEDQQYELVHAHTPRSLMVAAAATKQIGVPLVYHVHSPAGRDSTRRIVNRINAWLERRCAQSAAKLIAVSPSVQNYMIQRGFGSERVVCVPNGVAAADVAVRKVVPAQWTIGTTALFRPRKGVEVLLQAIAASRSAGANVRLRAIGPFESTSYETEVRRLVSELGIADAVDWVGFVSDVPAELAKVDVLALPSLFGEGLPMVVLEAMAAGVPVIASRVEGVPEAVRDHQEGLLVEPDDVGHLTDAIQEMTSGRIDYPVMSRQAQDRHRSHFSAEIMARRVAEVYDGIVPS